jgi:hypothetical protein
MYKLLHFLDRNTDRLIAIFLIIAVGQLAFLLLDIRLPSSSRGPEIGFVVHDLDLPDGIKVVPVLTSGCPHCRRSVPSWNAIANAGGNVVGVFLSPPDEKAAYVDENFVHFPLVTPPSREAFTEDLGISVVPVTLVLDSQNRITYAYEGRLDDPELVLERLNMERSR